MPDIIATSRGQVTTFRAASAAGRSWLADRCGARELTVGVYCDARSARELARKVEGDMVRNHLEVY